MVYHGHVVVARDASLGAFHPGEQVPRLLLIEISTKINY
jgi:hypothetical protein